MSNELLTIITLLLAVGLVSTVYVISKLNYRIKLLEMNINSLFKAVCCLNEGKKFTVEAGEYE
jgi:hypothetical protein